MNLDPKHKKEGLLISRPVPRNPLLSRLATAALVVCILGALPRSAQANDFDDWLAAKKGRTWTAADGRQINARLVSYNWPAKTVEIRKQDGRQYELELKDLSKEDNEFIKTMATVPQLVTAAEMKERVLAYRLLDVNGNPSNYGGKAGRLLDEFKAAVADGEYDVEIQLEALEWNVAEYRRVGQKEKAEETETKRMELALEKEKRDLLRRQTEALEATADATASMAWQLREIKTQIWFHRQGL
ncbi:hypothetical protein [Brevifollis gellanilyticus]|nr:hypothetical protein [Brevifollis gellanilyticus]